ncbi:MAG: hypothetical protein HFE81_00945 [Bacilli bacterium]|nr:hypothetical protein [Bacilli bacterium]
MEGKELETDLDVEDNEIQDDSSEYLKAVTFEIKDEWPEELKQQIRQLNEMSAIINTDVPLDEEEDDDSDNIENDDDYDSEDEEESDDSSEESSISSDENETFDNLF